MRIPYSPHIIPALVDLYERHRKSTDPSAPRLPGNYWEGTFCSADIDPAEDVIIFSTGTDPKKPAAFAWMYENRAGSNIYLRGPYLDISETGFRELNDAILDVASDRLKRSSAGSLEVRLTNEVLMELFGNRGFEKQGSYEKYRLFPLKGDIGQGRSEEGIRLRRWSGLKDVPVLMKLFNRIFCSHWDFIESERADWEKVVRNRSFSEKLVTILEDGGKPAGYAFGQRYIDYEVHSVEGAYLASIGLLPEWRGRGLGRILFSGWLSGVYEEGARSVLLDVDSENIVAQGLYRSFGFRVQTTEEVWRFSRETAGEK